ncbi:hypothetical protein PFUGPA_03215 [Plasmodium falciparum Palo Alto/Uganda]|uniref:Uncharacterized protein n=3 Tax=Plasmodium falciparum TaxID=5833 RepID=W4IX58_PLAFP|nr:hypothetical protein PFNF135_04673 [Plasmodium falciparum NF135/5.C10]ETW54608.1 hypothetical protein PFUGPA_03215 [Plasmodium falciparum Palo Alto/Uganda]ETW59664.1 hypothetical protein PFMC_04474 [Plasmodium falciparum CAMP/Malaysia]
MVKSVHKIIPRFYGDHLKRKCNYNKKKRYQKTIPYNFTKCTFSSNSECLKINKTTCNDNDLPSFLDLQEMRLIGNKKISFNNVYENRVNVFLKPLITDIITDKNSDNNYDESQIILDHVQNLKKETAHEIYENIYEDKKYNQTDKISSTHEEDKEQIVKNNNKDDIVNKENLINERHAYVNDENETYVNCNIQNCKNNEKIKRNNTHDDDNNNNDNNDNNNDNNDNNRNGRNYNSGVNKKRDLQFLSQDRYNILLKRKHKYIYDFEVYNISELSKYEAGEIVNVYFYNKLHIGIGLLNRKSNIVINIIDRDISKNINDQFFIKKLYESIKRRFHFLYNIKLYEYIYSFHIRKNLKLFCKVVNSVHDSLPGLVVYIFDKHLYIRYDNLSIQKYSYIFEKELETIFSPKNIFCKKIISKKEKRAQMGKEYILEQIKGTDLELNYDENGYTFYNNITNISYDIFHIENKQDRQFLQNIFHESNILNVHGNVGEYIINTSFQKKKKNINTANYSDNISIILSDSVKNTNYINKNIELNKCDNITSLHREDILEELNNMYLNNLKFDLIIYNIKSNIVYRKNSYISVYGKRHIVTFKGIYSFLNYMADILQKNGLLFITVELSAVDYHKFLNIVKCVFENKKKNVSIIYENSCTIENNILCIDENAWYMRSVCFKLNNA